MSPRKINPDDRDTIRGAVEDAAIDLASYAVFGGVMTGLLIGNADRLGWKAVVALGLGMLVALVFVNGALDKLRRSTGVFCYRLGYARALSDEAAREAAGK